MPNGKAQNQGSQGDGFEDVEKQKNVSKKKEKGGAEKATEMWEHINKSVSKDKREEVRKQVEDKKKKRRGRSKKKFEGAARQLQQKPKPKQKQKVEQSFEPAKSFTGPGGINLPTREKEDTDDNFEKNASLEPSEESVNPFEVVEPIKPVGKRSLEKKPLDEKSAEEVLPEEEDEKEEVVEKQSVEKVSAVRDVSVESEVAEVRERDVGKVEEAQVVESKKEIMDSKAKEPVSQVDIAANIPKSEVNEFKEDIWDILAQAGLTKRRLLIFLIILVVGIYFLFAFVLNGDKAKSPVANKEGEENPVGSGDEDLSTSYIVGLEHIEESGGEIMAVPIGDFVNNAGINTALIVGSPEETDQVRYSRYIKLLREMQNIYDTDVYNLMDVSMDRREALENHLLQMNSVIEDGNTSLQELNFILNNLEVAFNEVAVERDLAEGQFFQASDALLGEQAFAYLEDFIASSQSADELKAYYNAYKLVRDMFENSLNILGPRYEDIFANKEAVIKGIRVFDVPNSDIKAIIRLSN